MANIVIFILFAIALLIASTGALGMGLAGEKGLSITKGFFIGTTIFGLLWLLVAKVSDEVLVKELYSRDLINKNDYEKTMEIVIKNNK